jgi:large subunit ribosomal protein L15
VKLHDLKPAPGSRKRRMRVGRGIAAGKGKTAGRGTKGQKSRSGGKIPAWFEGGQTPIHVRVPKLRGFKRRDRIEYQVVNVGRISEYAEAGRFGADAGGKEPLTVNAEVLASAGLISTARKPVKILGSGDIDAKVFVAADRFTASAISKIEAAGGYVQVLAPKPEPEPEPASEEAADAADSAAEAEPEAAASEETPEASADEPASEADSGADDSDESSKASK